MPNPISRWAHALLFAAALSAPSWGAIPAHPGMLNYVEGQASIDGTLVTPKSVGSSDVAPGQTIATQQGKAEILLTPGVFLRLADNSVLRVDDAGLANTSVELIRGQALVEATDFRKGNNIRVTERNSTTTVEKNGLYAFNADQGKVAVYDGKAVVQEGDSHVELKKGRETSVDNMKSEKFDPKQHDELYTWSDLRSHYLSEASAASARTYVGGSGWYGGGWYWNPYYSFYSYLPGDGFLYSPFGWGFYSPGFYPAGFYSARRAPLGIYGGGYRYRHYGNQIGRPAPVTRGFAAVPRVGNSLSHGSAAGGARRR